MMEVFGLILADLGDFILCIGTFAFLAVLLCALVCLIGGCVYIVRTFIENGKGAFRELWWDVRLNIEELLSVLFALAFLVFILWMWRGEAVSNWFLSSSGMFGKTIGGYEQEYLDVQYPRKHKDGQLVDCWEWRYQIKNGCYIVPINVTKPLDFFSEYKLHLLPVSKRSFLISGNKFKASRTDYDEVKKLLKIKYGQPVEDNGESCSFRDGKKMIGLVYTSVLGENQLYINAYRRDLLEENLPEELREFEKRKIEKGKLDSL